MLGVGQAATFSSMLELAMSYCCLHYHFVWATSERRPLLTPLVQPLVYETLRSKAIGLGAMVHAIGGMPDHVHLAVTLPPSIAVSTFVGQLKGVSSRKVSQEHDPLFTWQSEYGAFTVHTSGLRNVVDYIANQEQHHSKGTVLSLLERVT